MEFVMTSPHLTPLVDCGGLVFLSGQIAFDENGAVTGDIATQTHRCLERLEAVLHTAGMSLTQIAR